MSLSIGIIGLPNAGKSTLFNALVKGYQAPVADYPFTTIKPNVGVVQIPDVRLDKIAEVLKLPKKLPATVELVDIAGLVKNAHKGEGLGNQFLGEIRNVAAILHIVRGFANDKIAHVEGKIDPQNDLEIVKTELELADIDKTDSERSEGAAKADYLLSKKPVFYVCNVDEKDLKDFSPQKYNLPADTLPVCAKLEAELLNLSESDQKEYLESLGVKQSALIRVILEAYKILNLVTFYTLLPEQVQAWPIAKGTLAPQAAGKIHADMEKGFIAAEVITFEKLIAAGSWQTAKEKGWIETKGRDWQMKDGDVVYFKFS